MSVKYPYKNTNFLLLFVSYSGLLDNFLLFPKKLRKIIDMKKEQHKNEDEDDDKPNFFVYGKSLRVNKQAKKKKKLFVCVCVDYFVGI